MVHNYKGNDGDKNHGGMAHYNDLREIYARQMEYHGCGFGLFQPISARDMTPPCAGYFDRNGDWNLIARLSTSPQAQKPLHTPGAIPLQPFAPLKYEPNQSSKINIEWQPKTSQDVEAHVLSGGGQTPDNLPAGADVNIKYASKSKFGAVLMTLRPITLTAYNDERLFMDWLNSNRALLYNTYGNELRKYGMWVVTRTYTAPGCSINAWQDNSKESTVSLKAKASMMGELADGEMQWNDKMSDKDWCHYKAREGDGLVVFMDGLEISKTEWWFEGVRQKFGSKSPPRGSDRSHSNSPPLMYYDPSTVLPPQIGPHGADMQRRGSPQIAGYLAPPQQGNHTSYSTSNIGIATSTGQGNDNGYGYSTQQDTGPSVAQADIGVMPTWSENTAGPNTHGGTQDIVPKNDGSGGYLVSCPTQKKHADRQDSGLAGLFTKQGAPMPWEGIDSPVVGRQAAQSAALAPAATAPAPPAASVPAPPASAPAASTALAPVPETPTQSSPRQASTSTSATPPPPATPAPRGEPTWRLSSNGWTIDFHAPIDEETLKDAGVTQLARRSISVRRTSDASSIGRPRSVAESFRSNVSRARSLRRETRSISGSINDGKEGHEMKSIEYDGGAVDHRRNSVAV